MWHRCRTTWASIALREMRRDRFRSAAAVALLAPGKGNATPDRVQAAPPAFALMAEDGRGGVDARVQVAIDDARPAYGRIKSIAQHGTRWDVATDHGNAHVLRGAPVARLRPWRGGAIAALGSPVDSHCNIRCGWLSAADNFQQRTSACRRWTLHSCPFRPRPAPAASRPWLPFRRLALLLQSRHPIRRPRTVRSPGTLQRGTKSGGRPRQ
jgi:hypothetical protein